MKQISIGNILKNMRIINTKYTQKDIGNKLSIADNTISSYERENSQPDFETITKLLIFVILTYAFIIRKQKLIYLFLIYQKNYNVKRVS